MRWVVTGCEGQLGRSLVRVLREARSESVAAFSHADLDVAERADVSKLFDGLAEGPPHVLVNAAAFNAVDRCETEVDLANRVNGDGPSQLADLCRTAGTKLVHVSSDYVFDGRASEPYREDGLPSPQSAYGRSKWIGESSVVEASAAFLVVRTSWVFGPGKNFVGSVLRQASLRRSGEQMGPLRVVDDQRGAPTYAVDLAQGIRDLVAKRARGIFHLCNAGSCTWFELARAVLDGSGYDDLAIDPITTSDLALPAPRPAYSLLDCSRAEALGITLRPWREALAAHLLTLSDGGESTEKRAAAAAGSAR